MAEATILGVSAQVKDLTPENGQDRSERLESIVSKLRKKSHSRRSVSAMSVHRSGKKIIIPEDIRLDQAIAKLEQLRKVEETWVSFHQELPGFPADACAAFTRAVLEVCGSAGLQGRQTLFGEAPPRVVRVDTGQETIEIYLDKMMPSILEGGYMYCNLSGTSAGIGWHIQNKPHIRNLMQLILEMTLDYLRHESIYRHHAISMPEVGLNEGLEKTSPRVLPISTWGISRDRIIFNESVWSSIESQILSRITSPEKIKQLNIPLRTGVLLAGPYGTGKTLLSRYIASVAEGTQWTFLYVKNPLTFLPALQKARQYQPCIVFVEDVDRLVGRDRTHAVNIILNELDGLDNKQEDIITIFTTNYPDRIQKAMVRPGRIDSVIDVEAPDAEAATRFVEVFARNAAGESDLDPETSAAACGKHVTGLLPALIDEVIKKARLASLYHNGEVSVTEQQIQFAVQAMRRQKQLLEDPEILDFDPWKKIGELFSEQTEKVNLIDGMVSDIADRI